ncbi:hypothetical protein GOP47_0007323 [Adiantum capillus-veneris]|uniref:Uncharacterized protein n=1 Tax=Adiantum capillus-veneris TaxID=13818 RepID=A0A9D4ZJ72_ADICA|nr:hypothetical protein GOP47_0007323 [Adiantum capillus-veneris]
MAATQSFSSLKSVCPSADGLRAGTRSFDPCKLRVSTCNEVVLSSFHVRGFAAVAASYRPFRCVAATVHSVPTVADTKQAFITKFSRPIPSIYNNVIQELIVQQHLMRYNQTYKYDAVFALGFVTVYDQLMDGYPSEADKEAIFKAYIEALKEDPEQYRKDAKRLEEWASSKTAQTITSFKSGDGEVEVILKDISQRASEGKFHYSRFFAIGLFRLVERANATDPAVLEQLSKELNVSKLSVDRDLDVYRNLLSKLVQAKELLKEYVEREKVKQAQRESNSKSSEAVAKLESVDL